MDNLYSFVYRGLLTEESLDKAGRQRRKHFGPSDAAQLRKTLSFDLLDHDCLAMAQFMSTVYTAIHAFENMVRARGDTGGPRLAYAAAREKSRRMGWPQTGQFGQTDGAGTGTAQILQGSGCGTSRLDMHSPVFAPDLRIHAPVLFFEQPVDMLAEGVLQA